MRVEIIAISKVRNINIIENIYKKNIKKINKDIVFFY